LYEIGQLAAIIREEAQKATPPSLQEAYRRAAEGICERFCGDPLSLNDREKPVFDNDVNKTEEILASAIDPVLAVQREKMRMELGKVSGSLHIHCGNSLEHPSMCLCRVCVSISVLDKMIEETKG
jgi:hypothetical protein